MATKAERIPKDSEGNSLTVQNGPRGRLAPAQGLETVTVKPGCGLDGIEALLPSSVGLILSDMPSGETQAPYDIAPNLDRFWPLAWKALKPNGNVVLMASSLRFASKLIESQPKFYRYDLIWHKSIATGFMNASHRPLRAHEFILVFCREGKGTYHAVMTETGKPIHAATRLTSGVNYGTLNPAPSRAGATTRFPASVIQIGSVPTRCKERRHHQQKPVDLMSYLVQTYSDPNDLVVDPYAGSGSVGAACDQMGRAFVGWDINPTYGTP